MQENCTCGSVRGALGNRRPYRDSEVYDRRDVWVGLTPTGRLQASHGYRHWAKEIDEIKRSSERMEKSILKKI
jgi:hypothetical protein